MKCLLSVCFIAVTLAVMAARDGFPTKAQTLQKGISVEMAATSHATPMPEADNGDAWIVAVTADGNLYFGTKPLTATNLAEEMKRRPRSRQAKLYIKADARASFAKVEKAFGAGREVWFESAVLLTAQPAQEAPGTIMPPKGLEVGIDGSPADATLVEVIGSSEQSATLKINNESVPLDALQGRLTQSLQSRNQKAVLLKVDGSVLFAEVARVVDAARGAGAKVVLATAGI